MILWTVFSVGELIFQKTVFGFLSLVKWKRGKHKLTIIKPWRPSETVITIAATQERGFKSRHDSTRNKYANCEPTFLWQ
jgi:hypothetical protein